MAFEIYERNFHEKLVYLIGVDVRGAFLAKQLKKHLEQVSHFEVILATTALDREERQGKRGPMEVEFSIPLTELEDKVVVVVDDVLYSGNTMLHVVSPILGIVPQKIETAVLIDRGHRSITDSRSLQGPLDGQFLVVKIFLEIRIFRLL